MKKEEGGGRATSRGEKGSNNGKGDTDNKGCRSSDWISEYRNQRACAVLRWCLGRG